jgi:transcriptional regulator with XRE-family HTH domain
MDLKQQLVEKFKQATSEQGVSRSDIVMEKGVSRQAVDNYFHGRCSEQTLVDLLDWLGYSVEVVVRLKIT